MNLRKWFQRIIYPPGTFVEAMVPNLYIHEGNDQFFDSDEKMVRTICMTWPVPNAPSGNWFYVLTQNAGVRAVEADLVKIIRRLSKKEAFVAQLKGLSVGSVAQMKGILIYKIRRAK